MLFCLLDITASSFLLFETDKEISIATMNPSYRGEGTLQINVFKIGFLKLLHQKEYWKLFEVEMLHELHSAALVPVKSRTVTNVRYAKE